MSATRWARIGRVAGLVYLGKPGWHPALRIAQLGVTGLLTLGLVAAPFTETEPTGRDVAVTEAPERTPDTPDSPAPAPVRPTAAPVRTTAPPTARPAPPAPARTTVAARPSTAVPKPRPKPSTAAPKPSTCGAPANPWGYNFCGRGGYVEDPPAAFCTYFPCIASFWESTNGYVMRCEDGMFSHSGGRRGSCSHHGGNDRPLYG